MKPNYSKPFAVATALLALTGGVFALLPKTGEARPKPGDVPVIVELFTSEGCSSCPPADAALIDLAKTQPVPGANIIALGYHVDYWNRLGWRDPFSSSLFTARQGAYNTSFKNDSNYTPQAVVAGTAEFVGSDVREAKAQIAKAADRLKNSKTHVAVSPAGGDSYTVTATGTEGIKNARVFVAVTETGLSTQVKAGENAGRHLAHVAVVRRLVSLEKPTGTVSLPVESGQNRRNQKIVAWVQDGATGAILGAAQTDR